MTAGEAPTERSVFEAQRLMSEHPPVWHDRNKQVVFKIACPAACTHGGLINYTRWRAMALPERVAPLEAMRHVVRQEDVYDYAPVLNACGAVEWHVNFSDSHLFVAYGSRLFAQDEMQVAEHPVLGALREALIEAELPARTTENGHPTPILVKGVERRCRVMTDRNVEQGRPHGLYGNAFAEASTDAVRRATTKLDPPTITNLIAIAAPSSGCGPYSDQEIELILTTAYTGFRAAALEVENAPVAVHTGFWGCGAFGGNRILMALLQIMAAGMAGIDRLVFHTHQKAGTAAFDSAIRRIEMDLAESSIESQDLIERLTKMGFEWGVSDGN